MGLQELWFFIIAALFLGFLILEGFDFGVGMLMAPFGLAGRRDGADPEHTPARGAEHHRSGVGWQRGLADHRRRSDVRGVPRTGMRRCSRLCTCRCWQSWSR